MLRRLTKVWGFKAASLLVALYALCLLAPATAFALGDAARAAHCLTDNHHGATRGHVHQDKAGKAHVHPDGTSHQHSKAPSDDGKAASSDCCGLFCLSALPAASADLIGALTSQTLPVSVLQGHLTGRGPDSLYRPPIS
jgi:hypothetical protein